ncbi:dynein regulatory complex protein 1 [Patagioenas fasciata]|uniref:dynein regulatory complex protein 1 n=1 Tax=Patagioenas fasciata TaxID=372321 RepID=UPI003A9A293C
MSRAAGADAGWRAPAPAPSDPGPQERIAARRRRISARLDAKRRAALGEDAEPEAVEEEEQRRSHKEIEESGQRLAKLLFEGTQMVTNIQVAADLRETQRRAEEAELKLRRLERLEKEAKSGTARFAEITSKWALATERSIPQELWQLLDRQQQRCTRLLEQKNQLIGDLQQELKNKDEQYVQAIKQQSDDINLLLERMEEQIRTMLKTYRHKLLQIEKAFELERRELLDSNKKKWEEAIQAHNAQELEYIHTRLRKVEEFEKQLKQLLLQDEEEYNSMKIQLEVEVQNLEKQLQQMKATYHLTQEKLDFNLQVLRKQDEENAIIRGQQKRKINRLYTIFSNLRTKLAKQEQQFREERQSLAAHCERIVEKCKVVQRKMRHFALCDSEKFTEVWLMNEEEAKGLMRKALDADLVIHTQQLGLHWEEPRYWFLNNVGPLGCYKVKRRATELAAQILTESSAEGQEEEEREKEMEKVGSGGRGKENTMVIEDKVPPLRNICKKTAKRILELVSDESGFLLEGKQLRLLQALGRDERILMKLDSIFGALGIDSEDDLYQLLDFFLQYKAREVTVRQSQGNPGGEDVTDPAEDREHGGSSPQRDELKPPRSPLGSLPSASIHADDVLRILNAFMRDFNKPRLDVGQRGTVVTAGGAKLGCRGGCGGVRAGALGIDSEDDLYQLLDFFLQYKAREVTVRQSQGNPGGEDVTDPAEDREHGGSSPQRDELKPPRSPLGSLPSASIHADDVLRILNAFMRDFNKPREKDESPKEVLPLRDSSRDEEYWAALARVIPQPVLKLWDALVAALEEYYNVLMSRATLLAETSVLQQQNSELCALLEEYVSSRVNNELLCPPTKWMDLSWACPRETQ